VGDDDIVVGTVARLFRRKGYEQLIPIMAAAVQREPRLRFVWIGNGAQRAEYETELARLGLRERTILVGLIPPADVPHVLAGCDVLAHTSQWEGLPRAVVQALLMQVPAVAFDIDGTPEVILDGQTGRLVPLNDLNAFVASLCELAADAELRGRMGRAGREHCLERFDWRLMVDQLGVAAGSPSVAAGLCTGRRRPIVSTCPTTDRNCRVQPPLSSATNGLMSPKFTLPSPLISPFASGQSGY
jgi:glycosyltransferase involved in cell wall biosynthesis